MSLFLPGTVTDGRPSYARGFAPRNGLPANPRLWKELISYWDPTLGYGPNGGLTLPDWGRRRNSPGTLTNMDPATDWVMSPYGWALDFDGEDDYVDTGQEIYAPSMTIAALARLDGDHGDSYPGLVSTAISSLTNDGYNIFEQAGNLKFDWGTGVALIRLETPMSLDAYHSIAATISPTASGLYLDGILTDSDVGGVVGPSGDSTWIGRINWATVHCWKGAVVYIAIWNRALLPSEIEHLARDPHALTRLAAVPYAPALGAPSGSLLTRMQTEGLYVGQSA